MKSVNETSKTKQRLGCLAPLIVGALLFAVVFSASFLFTGCSITREHISGGTATIITVDTTYIYHGGTIRFEKTK